MYEEDSVELQPNFIPALLKYKWHLIAVIPLLLLLSVSIVVYIPPIYRSEGTVVVETQQIPEALVRSTVTSVASERIAIIQQRVMTREKLLSIVDKYDYFKPQEDSELAKERVLNSIRNNIYIDVVETRTSRSRPANTIAFSVGFEAKNPFIAQAIANELMTLFLNENVKVRTERASETTEFLKGEAEKLKVELEKTETAVAKYKQENKDALPEHLNLYMNMRERAEARLSDKNRVIRSTEEQLRLIESQLKLAENSERTTNSSYDRLALLQQEYERLLLTLTPEHPDVVAIRRQIEAIANGGQAVSQSPEAYQTYSASEIELRKQLVDLRSQLKAYKLEAEELETETRDLEERIIRIPQVERALTSLVRENQSLSKQYNSLVSKSLEASIAESLEEGLKAERFSILESAMQPIAPYKPDRKKLLLAAFALSFGGPIGLVLALGFLDKKIYGFNSVQKLIDGVAVLNVDYVPYAGEVQSKNRKIMVNFIVALIALLVFIIFVHLFLMPLDELLYKVLIRFSGG